MKTFSRPPGIFNDVLSPITPGPSSSNTCGPFRLTSLVRRLLGERPLSLSMVMAEDGGYRDTFYSMQSDLASIAGLLGKDFLTYPLQKAYEDAEKAELDVSFQFSDKIASTPSEQAEITVTGIHNSVTVTAISWGGGEIEISKINGCPVSLDGKSHVLVQFKSDGSVHAETVPSAGVCPDVDTVRSTVLTPVFPFPCVDNFTLPFSTAAEMKKIAKHTGKPLWQLALDYEKAVTGASEKDLLLYTEKLYQTALDSIKNGMTKNLSFSGVTQPKAHGYQQKLREKKLIPLGAADYGCLDALRIMEFSNSHGKIVCMPTGGASGIIPAAIKNTAEKTGSSYDRQLQALLVAGLFGLFYYPTHYSGSIGCQAEIGVAVSMAAAGLCSMLTDDADTIESAASLGGQSVLGMVCNAIDGYVQVPCILRNMTAVPSAMVCANAALAGLDSVIPLDEVVNLMLEIGKKIRPCNRAGTYYTFSN